MEADLLIAGGSVVDGTGRPAFRADLAIRGGRIAEVAAIGSSPDVPTLDATGLVVAPGFIDIHSHSDFTLAVDPRAVSAIAQGVTLEVVGNCGHGCAPMSDLSLIRGNLYGFCDGYDFAWNTVGEYLDHLESRNVAVNVAVLVPNGCLRLAVAGLVDRPSNPDELRKMKAMLEQSLDEGACGYSTGLEYSIEKTCSEEEIIELCRVTQRAGRFYATHTRNRPNEVEESITEPIRVAAACGVPLQISHISSVSRLTERSRWAVERSLELVEEARSKGIDVGFDMHTRPFGTTNLSAVLPSWALAGGKSAIVDRLRSPSIRKELRAYPNIVSALARGDWNKIVIYKSKTQPEVSRRSIEDISKERGTDTFDTIYDLLLAEIDDLHDLMVLAYNYRQEDLDIVFEQPACMVGSDATALATDGPLRNQSFHGAYSWASWFLRRFVRERKSMTLPEAIRRITSLPASRIGLKDRGVIRVGACADLAVFDSESFAEKATTFEPNQLAVGMKHVLVNGVVTLKDGAPTGNRGGQVVRSN